MTNKITGVDGPITGWLDGHTYLIGLMAYPIRHSMSPTMHNNAFAKLGLNYAYLCFEIGFVRSGIPPPCRWVNALREWRWMFY